MSRPRVAVLGEAIVALTRHPGDGPAYRGPFASGAPCIFASAASRMGCRVVLGAGVGQDDFGSLMVDSLAGHGVEVDRFQMDASLPTSAAFVRYRPDGGRSFIFYLDGTAALRYSIEWVPGLLAGADWLHVSGSTLAFGGELAETTRAALDQAEHEGVPISIDPNIRREAFSPALVEQLARRTRAARIVFASEGELEAIGLDAAELASRGSLVCSKAGAAGAKVLVDGTWHHVPGVPVVPVDPDGAGDIFAAAFVAATLAGRDPVAATETAVQVAGTSVTVHGPMNSEISELAEFEGLPR